MIISAIIILYIVVSLCALTIRDRKVSANIIYILTGVALILISGFRGGIDRDAFSYVTLYNITELMGVEPSFRIISFVTKILFDNIIALFVIYAIIGVSLKLIAIRQLTELWFLSLAIYIGKFFILHDMTQIRVSVASGLLLLCVKQIYDRKLINFLLLTAIATLFHYSAVIILPLWFLTYMNNSKKIFYWLIPAGYVMCFLGIDDVLINLNIPITYIQTKLELYRNLQNNDSEQIKILGKVLIKCAAYYYFLIKMDYLARYNRYAPLLIKIYGIGIFCFIATSSMTAVAFRMFELFGIVNIVIFPLIYYTFRTSPIFINIINRLPLRISTDLAAKVCVVTLGGLMLCGSIFYVNLLG